MKNVKENIPSYDWGSRFISRHPVIANIVIISIIAILGIYTIYVAIALFTKHGRSNELPGVEGKTYSEAIAILHDHGFKVDIRDSLNREDMKPGYVIEQFPKAKSMVKPGWKIFLYINAVHPKEVIIADNNRPTEYALKGESFRGAMAKLEELGFKKIKVVKVLGVTDRIMKVTANGRPVMKMQKIPVNANIIVEVSDGRLGAVKDSLQNEELRQYYQDNPELYTSEEEYTTGETVYEPANEEPATSPYLE